MIEKEAQIENITKDIKLYSNNAISIATFLGGPLAAGYLIGKNFKALDKPDEARKSIILGVVVTIILLGTLFFLPEEIMDKLPNQFLPVIYTGIVWGIVNWKQGEILKIHKQNNNPFYSGWKAAGIGFTSALILFLAIFGFVYLAEDNEFYETEIFEEYSTELEIFSRNESETLVFYDYLRTQSSQFLVRELDMLIIPKWEENIEIINKTNALEDFPSELRKYNDKLLEYTELRLQAFQLFRKSIKEDSNEYDEQLDQIHQDIEKALERLE